MTAIDASEFMGPSSVANGGRFRFLSATAGGVANLCQYRGDGVPLNNADHSIGGPFSFERRCILFQQGPNRESQIIALIFDMDGPGVTPF